MWLWAAARGSIRAGVPALRPPARDGLLPQGSVPRRALNDGESHAEPGEQELEELIRAEKKKMKAIKYRRIQAEFGNRGAPPRTLTSEALEQIRFLKVTFPEEWSVCQLARGFSVSEDVIRRVLKSRFIPSPERRMKQDAKAAAATLTLSHRTKQPAVGLPSMTPPVKALDSSKLVTEKAPLARLSQGRATLPVNRASEKEAGRTKPIQQRTCTDLTDQGVLKANRRQEAAHERVEQLPAGEMMDEELEKLAARGQEYQMKIIQRGHEFYDQDGSFLYRTGKHLNDPEQEA